MISFFLNKAGQIQRVRCAPMVALLVAVSAGGPALAGCVEARLAATDAIRARTPDDSGLALRYQRGAPQDYCEGFDPIAVGAGIEQPFEVVSATAAPIALDPPGGVTIQPAFAVTATVSVSVVSSIDDDFYRLDVEVPAGEIWTWNTETVLAETPYNVATSLGAIGRVARGPGSVLVPLLVGADPATPIATLFITVAPQQSAKNIRWRWLKYDRWLCLPGDGAFESFQTPYPTRALQKIEKPPPDGSIACLEIVGENAVGGLLSQAPIILVLDQAGLLPP